MSEKYNYLKGTSPNQYVSYTYDEEAECYRVKPTAKNELKVLFTGTMSFDKELAKREGGYDSLFINLDRLMRDVDLVFAPVSREAAADGEKFSEFTSAMDTAGFFMGITSAMTEKKMKGSKLAVTSDSVSKPVYVEANGIKIALICHHSTGRISNLREKVAEARCNGAEMVMVSVAKMKFFSLSKPNDYVNCGADFIFFTNISMLKRISMHKADDGRKVYIAESLGTAVKGSGKPGSAAVRIRMLKDYEGKITTECEYIPFTCNPGTTGRIKGYTPLMRAYVPKLRRSDLMVANKAVRAQVGKGMHYSRATVEIRNKNAFQPQLSIAEICEILDVNPSFYDGKYPINKKVPSIVSRKTELKKGCVFITEKRFAGKNIVTPEMARDAGAIMLITTEKIDGIPCLIVDDTTEALIKIAKAVRNRHDPLTVAITGTVGKSTTTDMIKTVMKYGYNVLDVRGNFNSFVGINFCLQKLSDKHDCYVQEVHGGSIGAAALSSEIIRPNIAVVTYIGDAHLSQVGGTVQDVLKQKLGIIEGLQEGGYLLVNNDNVYLQDVDVPVNLVRYAAENTNSDYYAENIVPYDDHIEFTIVAPDGKYDAVLNCSGIYNVANAVCAFAVGRLSGIDPYRLIAGISRFRTSEYRQNTVFKDGYKIIMDCSSATPDSMDSAIISFGKSEIPSETGRRIAILGNVAMLGKKSTYWHEHFGDVLAENGVDIVITYGKHAAHIAERAGELGVEAYSFLDEEELKQKICEVIRPGDALLFKSSPKGGASLIEPYEDVFGKIG